MPVLSPRCKPGELAEDITKRRDMVLVFERTLQQLQQMESGTDATQALHVQLMRIPGDSAALSFSDASRQALPLECGPAVRLALRAPAVQWEMGHSRETHLLLKAEVRAVPARRERFRSRAYVEPCFGKV
jgi:hypothetical protein